MNLRSLAVSSFISLLAFSAVAEPPRVQLGIDVLAADGFKPLVGKRIGLITNPSGVAGDLRSTIDVLAAAPNVQLVALFGPEHGVRGNTPAGEHVADQRDERTGLPIRSLYGKTRKPTPEMLADIDLLVFDLQDIGSRSYTFISTMAVAMAAAAENGKPLVVLDRPNPVGGVRVEGRPLDLKFQSFVGQLPIAYVHGLTVGELARMIDGEGWLGISAKGPRTPSLKCDLTVIPMKGWRREMLWADTGLTWVPTSPHIPRAESGLFYAATGLFGELGVLSEGVGYTLPFELAGHPELDPYKFANELNERKLAGVFFRPLFFQPFYGRLAKKNCGGVQVIFSDPHQAELSAIAFHVLDAARKSNAKINLFGAARQTLFDKVCGTDKLRQMFEAGRSIDEILTFWRSGVEEFRRQRAKYLLYN